MTKKLVSFRFEAERLEELRELANVYTNGNATDLLEGLIRRMYFLEPLAMTGKYRTKGFGVNRTYQEKIKEAWDLWMDFIVKDQERKQEKVRIEINGEVTALKRSEITQIAHILKVPIDTTTVYTLTIKKSPRE